VGTASARPRPLLEEDRSDTAEHGHDALAGRVLVAVITPRSFDVTTRTESGGEVDGVPAQGVELVIDLFAVSDTDVTTLLRVSALERDLTARNIALRFDNVGPRLLGLGRRTPGVAGRWEELVERRQRKGEAEAESRQ
jgi:hypothetical protein